MLESHFSKAEKTWFNSQPSTPAAIDYLSSRGLDFTSSRQTLYDARRGRTLLQV